jgi:hypothetical protein
LKERRKVEETSENPDRDGCRYGTAESKEMKEKANNRE